MAVRPDLSADASWTDAADDGANAGSCRRAMAVVEPDRTLGAYPNGNAFHVDPNVQPAGRRGPVAS